MTERTRKPAKRGSRGGRGIPVGLQRILVAVLGSMAGIFLFDRVLMPRVVRHNDVVQIPSLSGKDLGTAEDILRRDGLVPVRAPGRYFPGMPKGLVLDESPSAGLTVKRGRQVGLIPSLGSSERRVPDLVGSTVRMAKVRLSEKGLQVRRIDEIATDLVEPGQVISTSPEAGTALPEEASISLLVSRAAEAVPYFLPDLRGRIGSEAASWLGANGFQAVVGNGEGGAGIVVSEDPPPGSPVWPGSRVRLSVAPGGRG